MTSQEEQQLLEKLRQIEYEIDALKAMIKRKEGERIRFNYAKPPLDYALMDSLVVHGD